MTHTASTVKLSILGLTASAMLAFAGTAGAATLNQFGTSNSGQTGAFAAQNNACDGKVAIIFMQSLLPTMMPDYHIVVTEAPQYYNAYVVWSRDRLRSSAIVDLQNGLATRRTAALCPNGIMARFSPDVPSTYGKFNVPSNGAVLRENLFGGATMIGNARR